MAYSAADLKMVDDHIALGERHVSRQIELIAWLRSKGYPTEMAEELLTEFESTLVQHRAHRDMTIAESEPDPLEARTRGRGTVRPPATGPRLSD
jgi:hemerythrin